MVVDVFVSRFLWPNFNEDSSNFHIILVALMVNVKRRENLGIWGKTLLKL